MARRIFEKRSRFPVPAAELFAWHERPGAFERLCPPWEKMRLVRRDSGLQPGARTILRVPFVGPFKKTWVAEHTVYEPGVQFQDVQVSGPFASWVHTHRVEPDGSDASHLVDHIEYALPLGWLGRLFGGGKVRRMLEQTFAYRHAVQQHEIGLHATRREQRPWRILVSGASGLVGSALVPFLTTGGHQVLRLTRRPDPAHPDEIGWDDLESAATRERLEGVDAVIHLAGENIAGGRWTAARMERIRTSRVEPTTRLARVLASLERRPQVLLSGSAVGYYGSRGDEALPETSANGEGFLAEVCRAWEEAAEPARQAGIRVVHPRFGVILSPQGGALAKMLPPFRMGVGGRIGNGRQWFAWIALDDVLGALHHCLFEPGIAGPVNCVAPDLVTNRAFTKTLGRVLRRPTILPMPAFAARSAFGKMANETLLASQKALPTRLEETGFRFFLPHLEEALRHLLGTRQLA